MWGQMSLISNFMSCARLSLNSTGTVITFVCALSSGHKLYFPISCSDWNITRQGSPVDNRPSADKFHHSVIKKFIINYMWLLTCDTWHVTHVRWGRWTISQNISFLALRVWELRCWRYWLNSPGYTGLLNILSFSKEDKDMSPFTLF